MFDVTLEIWHFALPASWWGWVIIFTSEVLGALVFPQWFILTHAW